jgi:hypothetical protein
MQLPLAEDYALEAGQKQLRAVAVERGGARMVTGGLDSVLKFWDFAGMVGNIPKPFRQFVPVDSHAINALDYSPTGGLLLCIPDAARARVYDREGGLKPVLETAQGDPYVRTPENTHGHTHASAEDATARTAAVGGVEASAVALPQPLASPAASPAPATTRAVAPTAAAAAAAAAVGRVCQRRLPT